MKSPEKFRNSGFSTQAELDIGKHLANVADMGGCQNYGPFGSPKF